MWCLRMRGVGGATWTGSGCKSHSSVVIIGMNRSIPGMRWMSILVRKVVVVVVGIVLVAGHGFST
jgi:hypothetical protein